MKSKFKFIAILMLFAALAFTACGGDDSSHSTTSWVYEIPKTGAGAISGYTLNTREDGSLQKGAVWPSPRFTLNPDSASVTDNLTGLIWARDANLMYSRSTTPTSPDYNFDLDGTTSNDGMVTWLHALDYIKKLNTENYLGHNDWRLPNINEFYSITNMGADTAQWLTDHGYFTNVNFIYWSGTTYSSNTIYANGMWINSGYTCPCTKDSDYFIVWPVRGGITSPKIPKTGQTTKYADGDDGNLQVGYDWPNPRFHDNGNGTITDYLTGLIWQKTVSTTLNTWSNAIVSCSGVSAGGYNDWRMPNRNELLSLSNFESNNNASWLNSQGFENAANANYWSSTTNCTNTANVWPLQIGSGISQDVIKSNSSYFWAVRGGR
ncbi:MAG: DUF1566 domain-containing protein [Spirochaetota bacterium]